MKDITAVKAVIGQNITLGAVLGADRGLSLSGSETQLSCPFHGKDIQKSARYYSATDSMYCWVCKRSWDLYGYISQREDLSFYRTIDFIVDKYHIDISKVPDLWSGEGETAPHFVKNKVEIDNKKLVTEKIKMHLVTLRDKIDPEKYARIVFAFMLLKHNTEDDVFMANSNKLANLIVKMNRGQ